MQSSESSSELRVILDMSKEDRSASDVIAPVSKWSLQEEVLPPMEPIMEENIEMPEAQTDRESDMRSWITWTLQRTGEVTFSSLLPLGASRSTAAHTFHSLLELLSPGEVTAQQNEPNSDITINPAKLGTAA